jgi:hypothetical protein
MTYEQLKNLKTEEFKRFCGVILKLLLGWSRS